MKRLAYTVDAAFNAGCDARLAGESYDGNPYISGSIAMYRAWAAGWLDVDKLWGCRAKWPVQTLPLVACPREESA